MNFKTPVTCMLISLFATFSVQAETVSVMTYNLENFFDTKHDKGKHDYTYLPLELKQRNRAIQSYCKSLGSYYYRKNCLELDWSKQVMNQKIRNLAEVIKSYNNGLGPDILVLQEVENINALKQLNSIGNLHYLSEILLEGPDSRGIDVAILSRFPLARTPKKHKVDFSDIRTQGKHTKETRVILEATFQVGSKLLTVFGNHWPSQRNIDEARVSAAKTLVKAAMQIKDSAIIATGDFNTLDSDSPHAINDVLLKSGKSEFIDSRVMNPNRHMGTHWYRGKWSALDRIFFFSRSTGAKCAQRTCAIPNWKSYQVLKPDFAMTSSSTRQGKVEKVPMRFNAESGQGYSDHLPALIEFEL